MVIINGKIFTCENSNVIDNGYVAMADGKIIDVAKGEYKGRDTDIYDAKGNIVVPGFIDAHCHLGMWEDGLNFEGDDGNEDTEPCTPHLRALDAVNPMDRTFDEALAYGITSVVTGPGSVNPVAGQIMAMKTYGNVIDDMVIKAPVAMKFALGENPKTTYSGKDQQPATRMAITSIIREQLYKAKRYLEEMEKYENDTEGECDPPEYDIKNEAMMAVIKREIPAHFHAHRADDICTALRLFKEFNLDGVIVHGTEAYLVADAIKKANIPVICGPIIGTRTKPELRNMTRDNVSLLLAKGIDVSINTDAPEVPIDMLLTSVAMATKDDPTITMSQAIELVTINAAKVCGIEDTVGSIKKGKDADIVIFDQNPIGLLIKPCVVFASGKIINL